MTVLQPGATLLRACKVGFQLLISTGDHPPRSISPCRARFPRDRRNLHDLAPDRELRELHRGDRRFSGGCSLVRATRLSGAAMSEKPDYKDTVFLPKTDFPMKEIGRASCRERVCQ